MNKEQINNDNELNSYKAILDSLEKNKIISNQLKGYMIRFLRRKLGYPSLWFY